MYKLKLSRREKTTLLRAKWIILVAALLCIGLVIWLAWIRPAQKEQQIASFEECKAAGHPIQESYPEVCAAPSGKRFVNPVQEQAHKNSLNKADELTPPSNPELLYLDIDEWNVRVPLTVKTFDLAYNYIEDGFSERIYFSYKRLVAAQFCQTDVGVTLTRSGHKHEPPFSPDKPAPSAHIGDYYFYLTLADKPCYKTDDKAQVALVKEIAGKQSLAEATHQLISKLEARTASEPTPSE
jgi:hypothetical protein